MIKSKMKIQLDEVYLISSVSAIENLNRPQNDIKEILDQNGINIRTLFQGLEKDLDPDKFYIIEFVTLPILDVKYIINKEKLTQILKCIGVSAENSSSIAEKVFELIHKLMLSSEFLINKNRDSCKIAINEKIFQNIVKAVIKNSFKIKPSISKYWDISSIIVGKTFPIVVIIGGTSGTGKSTVASLVASRLGISTILSTDTIRHIMRNFLTKEEAPVLFASTYEAWKYVKSEGRSKDNNENEKENKILIGYQEQSRMVGEKLIKVVDCVLQRGESVIIEGVHLIIENIKAILKRYKYVFPFLIHVKNKDRHMERFALRAQNMSLDPKLNKYVDHFEYIQTIQNYLTKSADEFLLPKVDNLNIAKSIQTICETILRSMKCVYTEHTLNYDEAKESLENYYNCFHTRYINECNNLDEDSVVNKLFSSDNRKDFEPKSEFDENIDNSSDDYLLNKKVILKRNEIYMQYKNGRKKEEDSENSISNSESDLDDIPDITI